VTSSGEQPPIWAPDVPLWRHPAIRRLALVSLLGGASFNFLLASVPLWVVQHGSPTAIAGLPTTVMLAATVVAQGFMPALTTRLGTGRVLAAGLLAMGVPAPFYAINAHLSLLLPIAAVRGCGFGALTVIGAALTATLAPPGRHGESVGLYGLATALPTLLGVPLGVALTQSGGFGWVTAVGALPVLGVPLALRLNVASTTGQGTTTGQGATGRGATGRGATGRGTRGQDPPTPVAVAPHRAAITAILVPSIVLFVVTFSGGGLTTFLPVVRRTGHLATFALLVFAVGTVLGRWRLGRMADTFGTSRLLPAAVGSAAVGMALTAVGLSWAVDSLVVVGAIVFGFGYGATQNLTIVLAFARAGPGRVAMASAVWNAAYDAGTALGAIAVGQVAATGLGLPRSFGLTGGLMAVTLMLLLPIGRWRPRRRTSLR
jgi:predicted MFS family arabinose efflux permease